MITQKEHSEALALISLADKQGRDIYKAKVIQLYWKANGVETHFSKILREDCKGYELAKHFFYGIGIEQAKKRT